MPLKKLKFKTIQFQRSQTLDSIGTITEEGVSVESEPESLKTPVPAKIYRFKETLMKALSHYPVKAKLSKSITFAMTSHVMKG